MSYDHSCHLSSSLGRLENTGLNNLENQKVFLSDKSQKNNIPYSFPALDTKVNGQCDLIHQNHPHVDFTNGRAHINIMLLCNFIIQLHFKFHSSKLAKKSSNLPEINLKSYSQGKLFE